MSAYPNGALPDEGSSGPPNEEAIEKLRRRKSSRNVVLISVLTAFAIGISLVGANILMIVNNPKSAFMDTFDTGVRGDSDPLPGDDLMTPDGVDWEDDEEWESEEAAFETDDEGWGDDSEADGTWDDEFEADEEWAIGEENAQAETTPTPEPMPETTIDPALNAELLLASQSDPAFMRSRLNVLLLGLDLSPERLDSGSFRTDTMVLVTIDFDNQRVDLISIPRDSYVKIYNKRDREKINAAFGVGGGIQNKEKGYEYAAKTVSQLFGNVPIHYTIGFDMTLVKEVVDAMGGIDFNVDIDVNMNGRTLQPGFQHLDGQGVLDYCRMRKGSSDYARVERQQRMLLALGDQLRQTSQWTKIPAIYQAVNKSIDTQLNIRQISSLALFASRLESGQIQRHIVPGEYVNLNNRSYWGISNPELKTLIEEIFGIENPKLDAQANLATLKSKAKKTTQKTSEKSAEKSSGKSAEKPAAKPAPSKAETGRIEVPNEQPGPTTKPKANVTPKEQPPGVIDLFDIPDEG